MEDVENDKTRLNLRKPEFRLMVKVMDALMNVLNQLAIAVCIFINGI